MADIDKAWAQLDEWAQIAVAGVRKGATLSLPDELGAVLEIFVVHDSVNAHANGVMMVVEVSGNTSGDEDWVPLPSFNGIRSSGGTAATANVDVECAAEATQLKVDTTTGFVTKMDRYFVKNATIANSEVVRNNGYASDDYITLLDGLTNIQQTTADVFNIVESWLCRIPQEYRRVRVIYWNDDADCTVCTRTMAAEAEDIT